MTRRRAPLVLALVVLGAVTLAACGVEGQSTARPIDRPDVPFGLLDRENQTATTSTVPDALATALYFVNAGRLVTVDRKASPGGSKPAAVLARLLDGPSDAEVRRGIRTLLSPDLAVTSVALDGTAAAVDLTGSFGNDTGVSDRRLAVAQLVFTATQLPGIDQVRLLLDGKAIDVPDTSGKLQHGVLTRADFPEVAPSA